MAKRSHFQTRKKPLTKRGKVGFYVNEYSTKRVQKTEEKSDCSSQPVQPLKCPRCDSEDVWKDGLRYTKHGEVQRFLCRDCDYRFSDPIHMNKNLEPYTLQRRVCVTEGTKNLAKVETRTKTGLAGATNADTKSKLFNFAWWMKKEGYAPSTITTRERLLRTLTKRGANLDDPETVKEGIANQNWCNKRKMNAADAYTAYLRMHNQTWNPPRYRYAQKIPYIPKEEELDSLIAGCGPKTSTFLQLLKETGARCGEAHSLKWTDIDLEAGTVRITPEKGSNPRIFKISNKLLSRLIALKAKNSDRIFSKHLRTQRRLFQKQRKNISRKLQNPRLRQIHFHTFRHWKATMEYHKTNDIR